MSTAQRWYRAAALVACEAILAADALHGTTGGPLRHGAARWWDRDRPLLHRPRGGGWWQELALTDPATSTWSGKPDVYHSYQALLFPSLR